MKRFVLILFLFTAIQQNSGAASESRISPVYLDWESFALPPNGAVIHTTKLLDQTKIYRIRITSRSSLLRLQRTEIWRYQNPRKERTADDPPNPIIASGILFDGKPKEALSYRSGENNNTLEFSIQGTGKPLSLRTVYDYSREIGQMQVVIYPETREEALNQREELNRKPLSIWLSNWRILVNALALGGIIGILAFYVRCFSPAPPTLDVPRKSTTTHRSLFWLMVVGLTIFTALFYPSIKNGFIYGCEQILDWLIEYLDKDDSLFAKAVQMGEDYFEGEIISQTDNIIGVFFTIVSVLLRILLPLVFGGLLLALLLFIGIIMGILWIIKLRPVADLAIIALVLLIPRILLALGRPLHRFGDTMLLLTYGEYIRGGRRSVDAAVAMIPAIAAMIIVIGIWLKIAQ